MQAQRSKTHAKPAAERSDRRGAWQGKVPPQGADEVVTLPLGGRHPILHFQFSILNSPGDEGIAPTSGFPAIPNS